MSASTATKKKDAPAIPAEEPAATTTLQTQTPGHVAIMGGDLDEFAGAGTSDRREDNVVPFLNVLQKGSPQVNDKKNEFIRGAKPGMLFNSATQRIYDCEQEGTGPLVLQAHMEVFEVEWIPRAAGGGFVERHPLDTPLLKQVTEVANPQDKSGKRMLRMLPNGHQLVTTAYHYLIMVETLEPVVLSLTSTGMQTHRKWNTLLRNKKVRNSLGKMVIAPSFATVFRLRTFWQENESGDWFTLTYDDLGWVDDQTLDAYNEAKSFRRLAMEEGVRVAAPAAEDTAASPTIDGKSVADDAGVEDDSPL